MLAYCWYLPHRAYPADDAGITLRYAERIAAGKGFNYNDGESVDGASNPLHTLVLAGLLRSGLEPGTAILLLASVCLALTTGLLFATFARFYSRGAAVFAVVLLFAATRAFDSVVDGMETPIVMLLVALLFRALHARGEIFAGVVLGLQVANKLDGALAAIAFAAVFVASRRRFPWRATAVALLVAAPVWILLLASFGTILPNSMIVKLTLHGQQWTMARLWMHGLLLAELGPVYLAAWASFLWILLSRELRRSFPIAVVQAWFALHMVAFATMNLGGPYHWYASAPIVHSVILATFAAHVLACAWIAPTRPPRLEWDPRRAPRRMWPVTLALAAAIAWTCPGNFLGRVGLARADNTLPTWASMDLGRQAAGAWLRMHTSGTELLATFEGLPAYEYEGPVYDFGLLNSAEDDRRLREAAYLLVGPIGRHYEPDRVREGRELVATFRYDDRIGPHVLYATPGSEIVRKGVRHVLHRTPTLWSGRPGEDSSTRLAHRDDRWVLPCAGRAHFEVRSWVPPTLLFTPSIVTPPEATSASQDPVRLVVAVNGLELGSAEIVPGRPHRAVRFAASEHSRTGGYTFELETRSTGSEGSTRAGLALDEILVRSGDPLHARDFKLRFGRVVERIEHVASAGLPGGRIEP